jgi:DNA-binding MarR family transcriptional regulator
MAIHFDTPTPEEAAREILGTHLLRLAAERRTSRSDHVLTRLQRFVLMTVKRRGHLGVSELVDLLEVGPTTASQFITTLEERGWLHRELDSRDRRRHVITLTEAGQESLDEALRRDRERLEFWLGQLTGEERAQVLRLTHRMVEIMAAAAPEGNLDT